MLFPDVLSSAVRLESFKMEYELTDRHLKNQDPKYSESGIFRHGNIQT